jgi:hypothetical protein
MPPGGCKRTWRALLSVLCVVVLGYGPGAGAQTGAGVSTALDAAGELLGACSALDPAHCRGADLRVVVEDAPRSVTVEKVDRAPRDVVRQLWSMNLGGRLVVDSPEALTGLVAADQAIAAFRADHQDAIKTLFAFSGTVPDDKLSDVTYTEEQMNLGIQDKELPEKFATQE